MTLAAVAGGVVVGAGAAALGARLGIMAMLGLPVAVLLLFVTVSRPAVAVGLVIAAVPIGLKTLPVGFVVVQGVAMAAVAAVVLVRLAAGRAPLPAPAPLAWGLVVMVLCLLSTPGAIDATRASKQDISIVLGMLLVAATVAVTRTMTTARAIAHLLLLVGFVIAVLSLGHAGALHAVAGAQRVDNRLRGTFTEPNQFGGFSAIVVLVAFGVMLGARSRAERLLAGVVAAVTGVAMLLALSRGAWIGFLLGSLLLLVLVPRARRALAVLVVVGALAVPLLGILTPDIPQVQVVRQRISTLHRPATTVYDSRPAIWREAFREIGATPLLGQGPGGFPVASVQNVSDAATVSADHAHNVLLTVAAEAGIPAALALVGFTLSMLVVGTRTVRRFRGDADGQFVAGLLAALTVIVGQGLVDFTLRNADIFLVLAVIVGLVLGAERLAPRGGPATAT